MPRRKKSKKSQKKLQDVPAESPETAENDDGKQDSPPPSNSPRKDEDVVTDTVNLVHKALTSSQEQILQSIENEPDDPLDFGDIDQMVADNTNKPITWGNSTRTPKSSHSNGIESTGPVHQEEKASTDGTENEMKETVETVDPNVSLDLDVSAPHDSPLQAQPIPSTSTITPLISPSDSDAPPTMDDNNNNNGLDEEEKYPSVVGDMKVEFEETPPPPYVPDYSHMTSEEKIERIEEIKRNLFEMNAELDLLRKQNQKFLDWYEAPRLRAEKEKLVQDNIALLTECKDAMLRLKSARNKAFRLKTVNVNFNKRPLGIGLRGIPDDDGTGAVIIDVAPKLGEHLKSGMKILLINDEEVSDKPYHNIIRQIKKARLPLRIIFEKVRDFRVDPVPDEALCSAHLRSLRYICNQREFDFMNIHDLEFGDTSVDQRIVTAMGQVCLHILNSRNRKYASSRRLCRLLLDYGASMETYQNLLSFESSEMASTAAMWEINKIETKRGFGVGKLRPLILYMVAKSLDWVRMDEEAEVILQGAKYLNIDEMDLERPIERLVLRERQLRELRVNVCCVNEQMVDVFFRGRD